MTKKFNRCLRCGYVWKARKKNPKYCPVCHSKYWNVKKAEDIINLLFK